MKDLNMLVWLTQLGISVAAPLAVFVLLAVWLRDSCGWGSWVVPVGVVLGLICAASGFRDSLKAMNNMSKDKKEKEPPQVFFNDHD